MEPTESQPADILAIGAHAGDAEIACGMALAHHVRLGRRVAMLHCTLGERGHPTLSASDYAQQKRVEAMEAAKALGASVYFLPYCDGELLVEESAKMAICDVIRACRPSLILTHWRGSMHKDHAAANRLTPDAIFYAALKTIPRDLPNHWVRQTLYAENWEDPFGFVPEIYCEITVDDIALWEETARKYALFRNEWKTFRYLEYYRHLARVRGLEVGTEYASAFAVPPDSRRRRVSSLL